MKKYAIIAFLAMSSAELFAFCGFYVAKADAKIFNKTSQVILVRDGDYSVVTMSNDFKGDVKDFAMVVPVPVVLNRQDIRTVNPGVFSKLDAYSGPRLVEYHDQNPCYPPMVDKYLMNTDMVQESMAPTMMRGNKKEKEYKVTIEAEYKVDEYDILILSAKESTGLKAWLTDNGYKIPGTAAEVLDPYIKNNLKFFVVKVDAERLSQKNNGKMSPLQISFNSPKFMLPIRLGMANADGDQDMIVYGLTKSGRIECTNYRTVEMPTARKIPTFVRNDFGNFYKDLFDKAYKYQGRNAVFLEYAWNVSPSFRGMKCDPCVGPPPISTDLAQAGVYWNGNVHFTRLHVRYSKEKFAQDLFFQVTPNKENFQSRYIITNPARGPFDCKEGQSYLQQVVNRRQNELAELQALTGWTGANHPNYVKGYKNLMKESPDKNEIVLPINSPKDDGFLPKFIFSFAMVLSVLLLLSKSIIGLFKRRTAAL